MDTTHPDNIYESSHLEKTCKRLKAAISKKEKVTDDNKSEIVAIRKSMWENTKHGFGSNETEAMIDATQYINAMKNEENSYRFTKALLDKYNRLLYSPYFARIDFREAGSEAAEHIYIGLYSFIDTDSMEVLIHDWRAPVSSVFYEYEHGDAEYATQSGIIHGEVSLKRQFKIKDSRLLYMFDSTVKIDDEILQEVLSGNASEHMKSIVTTIQKEQNKVIRYDRGSLVIVQGAAGSGKTSIALHRIAYLLYRDRNLTSGNIMIFSPSHIFNDYISNVLPELGENNVIQTTFMEYAGKLIKKSCRIESLNEHMEFLLSQSSGRFAAVRKKGYYFKSSRNFLDAIRRYSYELVENAISFKDVYYKGRLAIRGSELIKVYDAGDSSLPVNKRLAAVRERAFYLLEGIQEAKKKELKKKADSATVSPRDAAVTARIELRKEFAGVKEEIFRMTRVDLQDACLGFYKSRFFFEAGRAFGLTAEELREVSSRSIENLNSRYVYLEDIPVLAYLKCIIDEVPDAAHIKHLVVDEAQDYNPLQYEVLKRLFPQSSFTILGDRNQMIIPNRYDFSFDDIARLFGREDSEVLSLTKSYRSTREISEFTRGILAEGMQTEGLNRAGKLPEVKRLDTGCSMKKIILEDIKALKKDGMESIAILCRTAEECGHIYKLLKGELEIGAVFKDDDLYKRGVNIIPSYLCKGLEFDAVLIYAADADSYQQGRDERLLYTLCTRALHRLILYYEGRLTPIIAGLSKELYRHIESRS
jgi:DNA helicase-2/ATP-dependent DNA helicase PcrA